MIILLMWFIVCELDDSIDSVLRLCRMFLVVIVL